MSQVVFISIVVSLLIMLVVFLFTQLLSQDSEECNKALVLTVAHTLHITGIIITYSTIFRQGKFGFYVSVKFFQW